MKQTILELVNDKGTYYVSVPSIFKKRRVEKYEKKGYKVRETSTLPPWNLDNEKDL